MTNDFGLGTAVLGENQKIKSQLIAPIKRKSSFAFSAGEIEVIAGEMLIEKRDACAPKIAHHFLVNG
jgi:hypothetical protein